MRALVALSIAGVVCAVIGGAIFRAAHGGTPLTRSIAYGCWFAAACVREFPDWVRPTEDDGQ